MSITEIECEPILAVPDYIQPWHVRYARWDGGLSHACKGANSGWSAYLNDPDMWAASVNLYSDLRTIEFLKRMGINWVYVTWATGFTHETERRSQEQLARYIEACHDNDIRCTTYLSFSNVFVNELLENQPKLRDCHAVHASGDWLTYGDGTPLRGKARRRVMCISHRTWRDYLLVNCRAAIYAGADALYFDNAIEGCVCDHCKRLYADYTEQHWGERLEMPHVEAGWEMDVVTEANQQAQHRFKSAQGQREIKILQTVRQFEHWLYNDFLAEVDVQAKKINPKVFVYRNTNLGIDCFRCDPASVIISENAHDPGLVEASPPILEGYPVHCDESGKPAPSPFIAHIYQPGKLVNNIGLYRYLIAAGEYRKPVRAETQGRADGTQSRYISSVPRRIKLATAEAAACGVNHAPHMDGVAIKEMYWGTPLGDTIMDAYGQYHRFMDEYRHLYEAPHSIVDTAVLINDNTHPAEWLNRLASRGVQFEVLLAELFDPDRLSRYKQIIVPDYMEWFRRKELHFEPYFSDEILKSLIAFAESGGIIHATKNIGALDQNLDPRENLALQQQLAVTGNVHFFDRAGESIPDDDDFINTLLGQSKLPVTLPYPKKAGVLGVPMRVRDGQTVIHLIHYASGLSGPIEIKTQDNMALSGCSPDGPVKLKQIDDRTWKIEHVDIYSVIYE